MKYEKWKQSDLGVMYVYDTQLHAAMVRESNK